MIIINHFLKYFFLHSGLFRLALSGTARKLYSLLGKIVHVALLCGSWIGLRFIVFTLVLQIDDRF